MAKQNPASTLRFVAGCSLLAFMHLQSVQAQVTTPQNANATTITLDQPVAITTSAAGTAGYDLWAQNNGIINGPTNNIALVSQNSLAIVAQSGGQITLDGTGGTFTVDATNAGANGVVFATGTGSAINLTGMTLTATTASTSLYGAQVTLGGALTLTNSTLNVDATVGSGPFGISIEGSGSRGTLTNVNLNIGTSVGTLVGIQATGGAVITGDTVNVTVNSNSNTSSRIGVQTAGSNSQLTLSNLTITGNAVDLNSALVTGAIAQANSGLTINGGTIGGAGIVVGLQANASGAILTATDVSVSSSRAGTASLVVAQNGGALTMTRGSITTNNVFGSSAVLAFPGGSVVNLNSTAVNQVQGSDGSSGGVALDARGGTINANGATIIASSQSTTSRVIGASLTTTNSRINLTNGSSITVTGGTASVSGTDYASYGVLVDGGNTNRFTGTNSSITANRADPILGTGVTAVQAQNGAIATLNNMVITANGTGSIGVASVSTSSQMILTAGTRVTTTGASGHAISIQNAASVSTNGATILAQGAGANALSASGAATTHTATIAGGTTLTSQAGAAIGVASGTANIFIVDPGTTVTGNGVWLSTEAAGTASISLQSGAVVNGAAVTAAGGSASVSIDNASTWNISGDSNLQILTFDGGTLRNTGTATVSVSNTFQLRTGSTTVDTNGYTLTVLTPVVGAGSLIKTGDGTLILASNNSYSGGTTISAGTLQIGTGGTSGVLSGNVLNNSVLAFNRSDTNTYSGVVSGTGTLQQIGTGTLILTGDHTYTGGTTISSGRLQLGNGGTTGSIIGDVANNGVLLFNRSNAVTYTGVVSGSGSLQKLGANTLTLTGNSTYTGGTTISGGILQLGDGGTSGSVTGDIVDNGALVFNRSDTVTYGGVVSGSGRLEQAGTGTTILTGANIYAGGTMISGGTLQLGNGGTSGSVTGNILDNGVLAFNRSDVVTYDGIVSGAGSLQQIGSGTTILTGVHTYGGQTSVAAGTLAVGDAAHPDAALTGGGAISVGAGATLGGYGSVTGNVTNDGTVAVGAAIEALSGGGLANFRIFGDLDNNNHIQIGSGNVVGNSLTIEGNYVGHSTIGLNTVLGGDGSPSDLMVVSGAGHGASGQSSLLIANIGGLGAFTTGNGIMVINAVNGATTNPGMFTLGAPAVAGPYEYSLFRGARDGSDADSWYLRNDLPPTPEPPAPTPSPGSLIPNYRQEVSLYSTVSSQAQIYGQVLLDSLHERTGDSPAPAAQTLYEERRVPCGPARQNRTCVTRIPVMATVADPWFSGAWARLIGQHGSRANGGGIYTRDGAAFDYTLYALQAGFDLWHRQGVDGSSDKAGLYVAVGQIDADVKHFTGARIGHNEIDAYSVGAYWTHYGAAGWYTDAVVQATRYDNTSRSNRGFQLQNDGYGLAASLEGGYKFRLGNGLEIEPQAQLVYQYVDFDNASDRAAQVGFQDTSSLAGRVGVRVKKDWVLDESANPRIVTTWLRANVWHEFLGRSKTSFSSQNGPVIFNSDLGGSWGEVQAGVSARMSKSVSLFASGAYQFGFTGDRHGYNGKVGMRVEW